jgi:Ni,Fe-hydrogenase III large subunit
VRDDGDCYTRTLVRIDEILKSTDLTQTIIQEMPKVVFVPPKTCKMVNDKCQGIQRIEAPRGELFYFVEIEANQIKRCRVRPPTYAYISALEPLLTNVNLGDVPMIVSSLDPCFACLDRVMVEAGNNKTVLNKKEFKKICGIHEH